MRNKIPQRLADERIKDFNEVATGFNKTQAEAEAKRCLQCRNPLCVKGCPVEIDIPAFIKLISEGRQIEALIKIKEKNNLPAVCGRVCPQEDQCENACILNKKDIPINIGGLERYASEACYHAPSNKIVIKNKKVAVVGSGPAGLTCAADLAKYGYSVTLFESLNVPGGVLVYGIPEFRLPKNIVADEISYIKDLGVTIETEVLIGNTYKLQDLFENGFKAIFIGVGAGLPQFLGIPGENLGCVYSANEFLTRVNLMKAYKFPEYATPLNIGKDVAVIGGGNVALDCSRVALRLGSRVKLIYRRTEKEMPGRKEEIQNAKEEGVSFQFLTQPVEIIGDQKGFVKSLGCIKMELGQTDESGRRRPIPIKGSDFSLDIDTLIIAIGQSPNPLLQKVTSGLNVNDDGTIVVNNKFMTSIPGVFAGGDIITGADTVISAMGAGKRAARAIDNYLSKG